MRRKHRKTNNVKLQIAVLKSLRPKKLNVWLFNKRF